MDLLKRFLQYIRAEQLFLPTDKLLLAVSGGLDSVVLAELCHQADFHFIIAHCNFGLRGEESLRDEQFVKKMAEKYQQNVMVKRFDTTKYAEEHKVSIQAAARELRYDWLVALVGSRDSGAGSSAGARYILTGHHLDDNIETMCMHFFRGTGIAGLRGMLPKQDRLIRPLLFAKKQELQDFAAAYQLSWVEDSSNESDKYARNYFRNKLIPMIEKAYSAAVDNLADNIERFRDVELLYNQAMQRLLKGLMEYKGDEVHIPVLKLKKSIPLATVIFEIIKTYNFSTGQINEVIQLLDSDSGKFICSSTHRILKNRNWLIISVLQEQSSPIIVIEENDTIVAYADGSLHFKTMPTANRQLPTASHIATIDASPIRFPLLLRKWKQGDYFYPLGMAKKKKLNRFFIDNKLSQTQKEKIWVLEMDKKIIWIVGMRIDDRFKITHGTQKILHIEMRMGQLI